MILVTIQFNEIDFLAVRCPSDIREIAVGRVTCIQIDGLVRLRIEDAHIDLMGSLTCHWVRVRRGRRTTGQVIS